MALFLSEAVNNYERKQTVRGSSDMAEAALLLLNISEQSAALTEAVMTAEFTLMRRCQNLSEGETSNKMKDFGKKVWHNLKAFAKTVWAKIKEICRMVWRKLKEWGSQVLDMFSGKEMEIHKEGMKFLEEAPRIMEKMLFLIEKGLTASEDAADDFKDKANDLEKDWNDLTKEVEKEREKAGVTRNADTATKAAQPYKGERDEKKGYVRVGKNWLKSVTNSIKNLATRLEKYTEDADKRIEQIEKLEGRMSHEDNQKDMSKAASAYQTGIAIAKKISTGIVTATKEITSIGRAVGKDETNKESETKKITSLIAKINELSPDNEQLSGTPEDAAIDKHITDNIQDNDKKAKAKVLAAKIKDIREARSTIDNDRKEMKMTYDYSRT